MSIPRPSPAGLKRASSRTCAPSAAPPVQPSRGRGAPAGEHRRRMSLDPVFGDGYTAERIDLGHDDEGPVVATLVHRLRRPGDRPARPAGADRDLPPILVGHGWSDYVFDRDLLDHLGEQGYDVWALDLR